MCFFYGNLKREKFSFLISIHLILYYFFNDISIKHFFYTIKFPNTIVKKKIFGLIQIFFWGD
jgi:hypothetical protein